MKIRNLLFNLIICLAVLSACSTKKTTLYNESNNMESYRGCIYIVQYEDINYVVQEVVYHSDLKVEVDFNQWKFDVEEINNNEIELSDDIDPCKLANPNYFSMTRRIARVLIKEDKLDMLEDELSKPLAYPLEVTDTIREISETKEVELEYLGIVQLDE